jgi:hypothetical protein
MSGMHMLPVYYTTTNTRKRKKSKKTQSQIAAEKDHAKFLKSMGIGSRSSVGPEQRPSKPWVAGSSPAGIANSRSVGKSGNPPHLGCGDQRFESSRSDQCFYHPSMAKKEAKVYNGERKLLGIATMHKSNLVPVFDKESAEDIAKMRRG